MSGSFFARALAVLALVCATVGVQGAPAPAAPAAGGDVVVRGTCDGWQSAVAGVTGWATSRDKCPFTGRVSTPANPEKAKYTWTIPPGSNGRICVEGQGWYWNAAKKKSVAKWVSLGCGTSGGGTVNWVGSRYVLKGKAYYNSTMGYPKVRAKVQPGFLGAAYAWK